MPHFRSLTRLMLLLLALTAVLAVRQPQASALSPDIVISQVYGGGGNSGAPYTHDFVELFNRGTGSVDLSGWSIQYTSATGTGNFGSNATQLTELTGTLAPGQYMLIQQAGGANGAPLPTADIVDDTPIAMAAGAGKIALVTQTQTLGCNGGSTVCNDDQLAQIKDLVGYGNANFYEGTAAAPTLSNTTAALRGANGCDENDNNNDNFSAGAPNPRNTASALNSCVVLSPDVVISQVYGGGGNSGANYTHDFIELFNRGSGPANLEGWSVQYASSTGTTWQVTALGSYTLQPGQYYLVQQAQGSGGTTPLPTPDASGSIAMSATNGKVALVDNTAALSGTCPVDGILDFVGFGTANCFEGTGATPVLSNTTAGIRDGNGCVDTDDNAADFSTDNPTPRNTASALNVCAGGGDAAPTVVSTHPALNATNVAANTDITVTFSEPVAIDGTVEVSGSSSGTQNLTPATGDDLTFTLDPTDFSAGETVTVTITAGQVSDLDTDDPPDNMAADHVFSFTILTPSCGSPATLISAVQGSGEASPLVGSVVTVEGIVVGDFQDETPEPPNELNGFFLQEEDADADGNAATSEGVFVFDGANPTTADVAAGDKVRVTGTVMEFNGLTEIGGSLIVEVCSLGNALPAPATINLPVTALTDLEKYEGMSVVFPQELTVTETFTLGRFGEVLLSQGGRLPIPTLVAEPGAPAEAVRAANILRSILLDDGLTNQNPDPLIHPHPGGLSATNTLRGGDTVTGLTGALYFGFTNEYRVMPTGPITWDHENPRPAAPPDVSGSLTVASANVLNYFTTLDLGPDICGPLANVECRGADSEFEFDRQRAKIINALIGMNADIVGLNELENNAAASPAGDGVDPVLEDIVAGLNDFFGAGTYSFIDAGVIGTDAIKVALIYKPGKVTPVGDFAILDSSVDPTFDDTRSRPVLTQTFEENATGARLTVTVNHLKSKGSACGAPDDQPDTSGGNCNGTRTAAATALKNWLATDPTGSGDPDFLIIGDLNSYAKEDPIDVLAAAGYTDLAAQFGGTNAFSYVFDGEWGYLDYALSSTSLTPQVSSAVEWHINADEPPVLDYNTEFKSPGQITNFYDPAAFRASDHDPILVGLNLTPPDTTAPETTITATPPNPSNSADATFEFASSEPNSTFECRIDGGAWTPCTNPQTYNGLSNGSHTFEVRATDQTGNVDPTPASYTWVIDTTIYDFDGFFPPVANPPAINSAKAGSTIPLKFSLGGNYGLDIFAPGYPVSRPVSCVTGQPIGLDEPLDGTLKSTGRTQYHFNWKTVKGWSGCREMVMIFDDGTVATALFNFKR